MKEWIIEAVKCPHCGVLNAARITRPRLPDAQLMNFKCWSQSANEGKGAGCLKPIWLTMQFQVLVLPKDFDPNKKVKEVRAVKNEKPPAEQPNIFE